MPIPRTSFLSQRGTTLRILRTPLMTTTTTTMTKKNRKIVLTVIDVYWDRSQLQHGPISATLHTDLGVSPLFFRNTHVRYKNGEN